MANPKSSIRDDKTIHFSAVAIIQNKLGQILLIDRATPPFGWAGVAGHVDDGESPLQAIIREVQEETGLTLNNPKLVLEDFVDWNWCGAGVTGHYRYLYQGSVSSDISLQVGEVKAFAWYHPNDLSMLRLEPVWKMWFEKLGICSSY
jgi:8-oxo-dGTP pyrophosphatase MutT (NUDIX family)